jgi:hypothetical protein
MALHCTAKGKERSGRPNRNAKLCTAARGVAAQDTRNGHGQARNIRRSGGEGYRVGNSAHGNTFRRLPLAPKPSTNCV